MMEHHRYHSRDPLYGKIKRKTFLMKNGSIGLVIPSSWVTRQIPDLGLVCGRRQAIWVQISELSTGELTIKAIKETQEEKEKSEQKEPR